MKYKGLSKAIVVSALVASANVASAATFVYVSNAEDGDISTYRMQSDGSLQTGPRVKAAKLVMPMAVSPDKRFLYASIRSKPYSVITYGIDRETSDLRQLSTAPLADSYPYISVDKSGRFLLGASYGGHQIGVNAIGKDGKVSDPKQVIPTGRNAHSIIVDRTNRYVFVPHLGSDQIFQFRFDVKTGRLTSNTPAVVLMKAMTGPRHIIAAPDSRFLYLLNELTGTVTTLSLDARTGLLTEVGSASALPPDSKLTPGAPRGAVGAPGGPPPRNTDNDIWASDLRITPDGKFLYAAERTSSSLGVLSADPATGKLTYISSTPTEKQPRGFAIDAKGRYMVVAGEKSDTISVYAIDQASGALTTLQKYPAGKGANWVEIVSFD